MLRTAGRRCGTQLCNKHRCSSGRSFTAFLLTKCASCRTTCRPPAAAAPAPSTRRPRSAAAPPRTTREPAPRRTREPGTAADWHSAGLPPPASHGLPWAPVPPSTTHGPPGRHRNGDGRAVWLTSTCPPCRRGPAPHKPQPSSPPPVTPLPLYAPTLSDAGHRGPAPPSGEPPGRGSSPRRDIASAALNSASACSSGFRSRGPIMTLLVAGWNTIRPLSARLLASSRGAITMYFPPLPWSGPVSPRSATGRCQKSGTPPAVGPGG